MKMLILVITKSHSYSHTVKNQPEMIYRLTKTVKMSLSMLIRELSNWSPSLQSL